MLKGGHIMFKFAKVKKPLLLVGAGIAAVAIVSNVLLAKNANTISMYLGGYSGVKESGDLKADDVFKSNRALNEKLGEESAVLLKNKNNVLPLAAGTKVTFFGSMSYNYRISGNGSGSGGDDANTVHMDDAFKAAGLDVNESAWNALETACGGARDSEPLYPIDAVGQKGNPMTGFVTATDWASYTQSTEFKKAQYEAFMTDSVLNGYTDGFAIVTIGRNGAEGAAPSFDMDDTGSCFNRTYLELNPDEKDLLEFVAGKFNHVLLLVNSAAPMELGFVDLTQYKIDAAVWIGYPGENGIQGIANLITNKNGATPSGRLADTWVYDLTTNPTYYNSGNNAYNNINAVGEEFPGPGLPASYFEYEEGIYVGYRYYETADELKYFDSTQFKTHHFKGNVKDTDGVYDADYTGAEFDAPVYEGSYGRVVQYTFGYGLSYTSFSQEIVSQNVSLAAHGSNSVTVRVKNTGDKYSGKEVIQLYMNAPKGQDNTLGIKNVGLEKAARTLVAFAKTDVLQPGESKDYVIEFETDDLATFDAAGKNAYVLEKGDYEFEVCKDSHVVLAKTNKTTLGQTLVYNDAGVGKRSSDQVVATNQLDDVASGDTLMDAGVDGYMSRFNGNKSGFEYAWDHIWDKSPYRTNEALPDGPLSVATCKPMQHVDYTYPAYKDGEQYQKTSRYYMKGATQQAYMDQTPEGKSLNDESYKRTFGAKNGLTVNSRFDLFTHEYVCEKDQLGQGNFADYDTTNTVGFADIDYNDPLWDKLLDQLTIDECIEVNACSGWGIPEVKSVGKPYVKWIDGPGESGNGSYENAVCWVCEVNLSATFNTQLVEEMGVGYGQESVLHECGGAYAPAMNAHRSPFEGRFFEYFCEDSLVAGKMGAAEIRGIQSQGIGVTAKHYALNDDCAGSPGAFTWVNEQACREIYLKPYELSIKEADCRGLMTSVIRVGFSSSSHYGLYVNITRNEWGFKGYAITDGYNQTPGDFLTSNACLFGGLVANLSRGAYLNGEGIADTEGKNAYESYYGQYLLREQMHGMLYQYVGTSGIAGSLNNTWKVGWIIGDVVLGLGFVAAMVFAFLPAFKKED